MMQRAENIDITLRLYL